MNELTKILTTMKHRISYPRIILIVTFMMIRADMIKAVTFKNNSQFENEGFVFVRGGCFDMGDTFGDGNRDERPVHKVCLDSFFIRKYETTVGEFRDFVIETGYKTDAEKRDGCYYWQGRKWEKDKHLKWKRPGFFQTDRHPVVCITWNDANEYIAWKRDKTGLNYCLPTEAQWEYAARSGGKREKMSGTSNTSELKLYAWYRETSGGKTHPVGQKRPNALGLYDMSGNAWEWLQDWYRKDYYNHSPKQNPKGPPSGRGRVIRGGSWYVIPRSVRTTHRNWSLPGKRHYNSFGFRLSLCLNPPDASSETEKPLLN